MSTSGHSLNSSPLSFVAMTMFVSVLSIGPLQGVGADIYQIEGEAKNIILSNTGDKVERRDWFRVAVSNSLWRIDMKPIRWTELGQEVTPVGEYAVSATWDGKQFVHDIESKPSPRQFVVGNDPFPFGVGDSSLYIIWYGLASGAYMEASGGKKLPPARMAKMEDTETENTVTGICVIHPEPPRLPLRVTLPLLKHEVNPQSKAVFLTNCVIQSSFPAICGTPCIPSQVRAEYFVYQMGLPEKVRRSGEVVVTVASVKNETDVDIGMISSTRSFTGGLVSDVRPLQNGIGPAVAYSGVDAIPSYGESAKTSQRRAKDKRAQLSGFAMKVAFSLIAVSTVTALALLVKKRNMS